MPQQYRCEKCNRMLNDNQFYTYKNGNKTEMCKSCMTMHVDNYDPETYLWLLEKMDVPYIPSEWNIILEKALAKDPTGSKINGTSVFGKYLSKMKLKQWNKYTWADTDKLRQEDEQAQIRKAEEQEQYEAMLREKLETGEINESQFNTLVSVNSKKIPAAVPQGSIAAGYGNPFEENNFIANEEMQAMVGELTDDDKRKMALKWRPPL